MLCGWSGIANVGLAAINTMRRLMRAEEFGQIEPYGYFDPTHVVIANGLIEDLRFPGHPVLQSPPPGQRYRVPGWRAAAGGYAKGVRDGRRSAGCGGKTGLSADLYVGRERDGDPSYGQVAGLGGAEQLAG